MRALRCLCVTVGGAAGQLGVLHCTDETQLDQNSCMQLLSDTRPFQFHVAFY